MINASNSTGVTISNVGGAKCPRCKVGTGWIRDGTYDFTGEAITAFRAIDPAALSNVRDVLREAKADRITPAQAADQIIVSAPELETLVRQMQGWRDAKWWIMALLAVLAVVVPLLTQDDGLSVEDQRALERGIRDAIVQTGGPAPQPKPPPGVTIRKPPPPPARVRAKRPGKTYGKAKRRKRP